MKSLILSLLFLFCLSFSNVAISQGPPPPPANNDQQNPGHGSTFDQEPPEGGNAPIGSGVFVLMGMAFAYGLYKFKAGKTDQTV